MRLALYGGTFDPPHLAHLRIAQAAADRLALDTILFAPVGLQPLKRNAPPPAPYSDRREMVRLLLAEAADPRLQLSDLDAPRPDTAPNYTFDTLARLRSTLNPSADTLYFLTGADALLTLPHWHRALDLLLSTPFIVVARPGFPLAELTASLLTLEPAARLEPREHLDPVGRLPHQPPRTPVEHLVLSLVGLGEQRTAHFYLLPDLDEHISSTSLRAALAGSSSPAALDLSPAVAAYIRAHALYQVPSTARENPSS